MRAFHETSVLGGTSKFYHSRNAARLDTTRPDPRLGRAAGLRYTTDTVPGHPTDPARLQLPLHRTRRKVIRNSDGSSADPVAGDPAGVDRRLDLPDPRGHLQATGRDARGRKQYRYHPRWREVRDETKYDRMIAFAQALAAIRRRTLRGSALARGCRARRCWRRSCSCSRRR